MPQNPKSVAELEDPGHLAHQRREWTVERIGWGLLALLVFAALLGFLGQGPLTSHTTTSPDGSLRVEYYSVERYQAPAELSFQLQFQGDSDEPRPETVELLIDRSFTDETTPDEIVPEPISVLARGKHLVHTFRVAGLPGGERIVYRYQHEEYGRFEHEFAVEGHEPLRITQWVLP
jgi:hypothetical protein